MFNELFKRIISSIIILPIVFFIIIKGSIYFNFFLLTCFLITIIEWKKIVFRKKIYYLGLIFIILSFWSTYKIRHSFNNEYFVFLFITGICISTDIGGFIFGKLIKGPKLIKISPNKTYSGMLGSFLFTLLFIYLFLEYSNYQNVYKFSFKIIFLSIMISAISQFGDIVISYFKRLSNVKDTGNIIPGHGGILDRIDGMIFAFPFSYFLLLTNVLKNF